MWKSWKNCPTAYEFLIISGRLSVSKVAKRIPTQIKKPTLCLPGFFTTAKPYSN